MFIEMIGINANKELVTIKQATELALVSRRTIYNWLQTEKIDWTRTASGSVRIVKDSLFRLNDRKMYNR